MSNRFDFLIIEEMVELGSKVLDIGCDDGSLLKMLQDKKKVDARGIELYSDRVNLCLEKGLPVVQGDANFDLEMYPDNSFDYVILSKTLQSVNRPRDILEQLLRIGNNTENIHLCTINDFLSLCDEINIKIIKSVALDKNGAQLNFANRIRSVNLIGEQAIFLLKKNND